MKTPPDEDTPGMLAVTARVDGGGTVTAVSGREDRTCRAIAAVWYSVDYMLAGRW